MNKYLVTIRFEWNEDTMAIISEHRSYINELIEQQVIEHYAVSMETQRLWITLNAEDKSAVRRTLSRSPFYAYWTLEVNELVIWDGQNYRLPVVQWN
jgi:hypothetical protein